MLVVDDLLVQHCTTQALQHPSKTLREHYTIIVDPLAAKFCGMMLDWNFASIKEASNEGFGVAQSLTYWHTDCTQWCTFSPFSSGKHVFCGQPACVVAMPSCMGTLVTRVYFFTTLY